jgi:hypothetical protein
MHEDIGYIRRVRLYVNVHAIVVRHLQANMTAQGPAGLAGSSDMKWNLGAALFPLAKDRGQSCR